jgi:hypothetical protein
MSEYSRAPGRGHRTTARERVMQVDRQPSPWPCVAMLAGLLLLCLMAPRYWQKTLQSEDPAIGVDASVAFDELGCAQYQATNCDRSAQPSFAGPFDFSGIQVGRFASGTSSDLLNLFAPPPIEELIATHAAMT